MRGAANSAISQGIGVATGLQSSFSFAGVAAAGVGAGIGGEFGGAIGKAFGSSNIGRFAGGVAVNTASALANAATRSAIDGSSFGDNIVAAIPDVVGQAIGNAVGGELAAAGLNLGGRFLGAAESAIRRVFESPVERNSIKYAQALKTSFLNADTRPLEGTVKIASADSDLRGVFGPPTKDVDDILQALNRFTLLQTSNDTLSVEGLSFLESGAFFDFSQFGSPAENGIFEGLLLTSEEFFQKNVIEKGIRGPVFGNLDARTAFLEFNPIGQAIGSIGFDDVNRGRLQINAGLIEEGIKSQLIGTGKVALNVGGAELGAGIALRGLGRAFASVQPRILFRGDTRGAQTVFDEGFLPRGDSFNLIKHAENNLEPPSIFVSSTKSQRVAVEDFSDGNQLFILEIAGGVNVNRTLGSRSPFPTELEIAHIGGVASQDIRGVTLLKQNVTILNPNFKR